VGNIVDRSSKVLDLFNILYDVLESTLVLHIINWAHKFFQFLCLLDDVLECIGVVTSIDWSSEALYGIEPLDYLRELMLW